MNGKGYKWLHVVTALFVTTLIVSNIIAVKLISVWTLVLPAAVILFPIAYIIGDVLTEVYGFARARQVIWTGFFCAALLSVTLAVVRWLPGDTQWMTEVGPGAFDGVLGTLASGRIIAASPGTLQLRYLQTLTEIATEGTNTVVFPIPIDLLQALTKGVAASSTDQP